MYTCLLAEIKYNTNTRWKNMMKIRNVLATAEISVSWSIKITRWNCIKTKTEIKSKLIKLWIKLRKIKIRLKWKQNITIEAHSKY